MIRKALFWLHLCLGVAAGVFIFIMAATGVLLSFERQIVDFADRDVRTVAIPQDVQKRPISDQLEAVRRAGMGDATAIVLRNQPQAATQFSIGRGKTVYVDPYTDAVLGSSSAGVHDFFFMVERLHRTLGAPMGSKSAGRWLTGVSNLLFGGLIVIGLFIWLPRKWSWKALRASSLFRGGLRGRARDWNWHNTIDIWCALPLLVISLTGVVMSFEWANSLLFRLSGSAAPSFGRDGGENGRRPHNEAGVAVAPNYDRLFAIATEFNQDWNTITLNVARDGSAPISTVVDAGSGGQPQKRVQYLSNRDSGAVVKTTKFEDGSLGQRLRAFVRFGHTGEWGGWVGQAIAAIASLGACVLVYTGLMLSFRRLRNSLKRGRASAQQKTYEAELVRS